MKRPKKYQVAYLSHFRKRDRWFGAILIEPNLTELKDNTPESFYHHEMPVYSDLTERFLAHGGKLKEQS